MPNYIVIITDGLSDNATETWTEAMETRAQGVTILVVRKLSYSTFFAVQGEQKNINVKQTLRLK